jgi:hypothetical protein
MHSIAVRTASLAVFNMTCLQANLLANLTGWTIKANADLFRQIFA